MQIPKHLDANELLAGVRHNKRRPGMTLGQEWECDWKRTWCKLRSINNNYNIT